MRRSSLRAALAVVVLLQVSPAFADPIAQWATPWMVTFDQNGRGNVDNRGAFGAQAQTDGQVTDVGSFFEALPGTPALVHAATFAEPTFQLFGISEDSLGRSKVNFERVFQLRDSPSGRWQVTLHGSLMGVVDTRSPDLNPKASVGADASIDPGSDPTLTPVIQIHFEHDSSEGNGGVGVDDMMNHGAVLTDGVYVLSGQIFTSASIEGAVNESGAAVADFGLSGRNEGGFRVSVEATPLQVPESATIVLIGVGASALGGATWRRRRKVC